MVLRLVLAEPSVRQASAAIGVLHEQVVLGQLESTKRGLTPVIPIQLYNGAIRAIVEKAKAGSDATSLVATTNVLFIAYEHFQGNVDVAVSHIHSGIDILRAWRLKNGGDPIKAWGRGYRSPDAEIMEVHIVPLLSCFNIKARSHSESKHVDIFMNPVTDRGELILPETFYNIQEARVALLDLVTCVNSRFNKLDNSHSEMAFKSLVKNIELWHVNMTDLRRRYKAIWSRSERKAANTICIVWLCMEFGISSASVKTESDWDNFRPKYEEMIRLAETMEEDQRQSSDNATKDIAFDGSMILLFHATAWKCRWPHLRRRALDLFARFPKQQWLMDICNYHKVFARIMELEEAHLQLSKGSVPDEDWLPSDLERIYEFTVALQPGSPGCLPGYNVTFYSRPQGPDQPWFSFTEYMQPDTTTLNQGAALYNRLSRNKPWTLPQLVTSSVQLNKI
ncbi:hypothetical protein N7456_006022 [Penicillium angulare]|uniref:Uncharacterized protein n=1 Tax=Penicillium angulare TaxID=116970 RepID=A0A9W9FZM5_9EURO|nr:hypothetical protein N7456_006022 [Penicillium angulare]